MTYLDEFLDAAAAVPGVRIAEHPRYGGVNPALHMAGSEHGKGNAADLNYGPPGAPAVERPVLLALAQAADLYGLNTIYTPHRRHPNPRTAANHEDHLHVDGGPIRSYTPPPVDVQRARRIMTALREELEEEDDMKLTDKITHAKSAQDALPAGMNDQSVEGALSYASAGGRWLIDHGPELLKVNKQILAELQKANRR